MRHGVKALIEILPARNYEEAIALEFATVRRYQRRQHYLVSSGSVHEAAAHYALEVQPFPWDEAHKSCPLPVAEASQPTRPGKGVSLPRVSLADRYKILAQLT